MPTPRKTTSKAKPTAKKGSTHIIAQIDVGFGSRLTIRGGGAGLSWTIGQEMEFKDGAWIWQTTSKETFEFKVLLNDEVWQQGENLVAKAGQKMSFTPQF